MWESALVEVSGVIWEVEGREIVEWRLEWRDGGKTEVKIEMKRCEKATKRDAREAAIRNGSAESV